MKTYPRVGFIPPAEYQFILWTDADVQVYDKGEVLPPAIAAIKNPPVDPNYVPPKSLEQQIADLKLEVEKLKAAAPK